MAHCRMTSERLQAAARAKQRGELGRDEHLTVLLRGQLRYLARRRPARRLRQPFALLPWQLVAQRVKLLMQLGCLGLRSRERTLRRSELLQDGGVRFARLGAAAHLLCA